MPDTEESAPTAISWKSAEASIPAMPRTSGRCPLRGAADVRRAHRKAPTIGPERTLAAQGPAVLAIKAESGVICSPHLKIELQAPGRVGVIGEILVVNNLHARSTAAHEWQIRLIYNRCFLGRDEQLGNRKSARTSPKLADSTRSWTKHEAPMPAADTRWLASTLIRCRQASNRVQTYTARPGSRKHHNSAELSRIHQCSERRAAATLATVEKKATLRTEPPG